MSTELTKDKTRLDAEFGVDPAVQVEPDDPVISGLDFEDIARILAAKGVHIGKDDPLWDMVLIFQACLEHFAESSLARDKLLMQRSREMLDQAQQAFTAAIKPASELALNTQMSALLENARQESKVTVLIHRHMKRLAWWLGVCATTVALVSIVNIILMLST